MENQTTIESLRATLAAARKQIDEIRREKRELLAALAAEQRAEKTTSERARLARMGMTSDDVERLRAKYPEALAGVTSPAATRGRVVDFRDSETRAFDRRKGLTDRQYARMRETHPERFPDEPLLFTEAPFEDEAQPLTDDRSAEERAINARAGIDWAGVLRLRAKYPGSFGDDGSDEAA